MLARTDCTREATSLQGHVQRCRSRLELLGDLRGFLGIVSLILGSFNRFEAFLSGFWQFHWWGCESDFFEISIFQPRIFVKYFLRKFLKSTVIESTVRDLFKNPKIIEIGWETKKLQHFEVGRISKIWFFPQIFVHKMRGNPRKSVTAREKVFPRDIRDYWELANKNWHAFSLWNL